MVARIKAGLRTTEELVLIKVTELLPKVEEYYGLTSQGIPIVIARYAEDTSDLSALETVQRIATEIMKLPAKQRNEIWNSLSPVMADFSRNEASYKALEQIYTRDQVRFNGLEGVDDDGLAKAWIECSPNARAARERKTAAVSLLLKAVERISARNTPERIELVSIASGSARCIVEVLDKSRGLPIHARMLDWDPEARSYSEKLAREAGVEKQVNTIAGDVIRIKKFLSGYPVDIAEAVGILDYLDDKYADFLLRQIYELLSVGGTAIVSNIMPNPESEFVHTAVGWRPMRYRNESELAQIFVRAGFLPGNCKIHRVPLGIYSIIEAVK
ncbi:MAG: class I SAM-dependent methyltransferase family protein [Patescibacteria group bacterium]|nr:class I SAM-dependent methyltransferase family protein [Patescibacteria group bacterium]